MSRSGPSGADADAVSDLLIRRRLASEKLAGPPCRAAAEVVSWLGAVQAQEFAASKWALALRARGLTDASIDRAFDAGRILRTHVLRPTWHFVTPSDIRWMLELTGPSVKARMAGYDRQLELDDDVFARARAIAERVLAGRHLTRADLGAAFADAGLPAAGQRLAHVMLRLELDGVVCSGPRAAGRRASGQGAARFTYALLEERAPAAPPLPRAEARAALARRYFRSHGPATLRDFSWWSSLPMREAREALASLGGEVEGLTLDGRTYWWTPSALRAAATPVLLLPIYDEYLVAHRDRDPFVHARHAESVAIGFSDGFAHWLVVDGRYAGTWRRTLHPGRVLVEVRSSVRLTPAHRSALATAVERYGAFLGVDAQLRVIR